MMDFRKCNLAFGLLFQLWIFDTFDNFIDAMPLKG